MTQETCILVRRPLVKSRLVLSCTGQIQTLYFMEMPVYVHLDSLWYMHLLNMLIRSNPHIQVAARQAQL